MSDRNQYPSQETIFDDIRRDYEMFGLLKYSHVGDPLNILNVGNERLDPLPSADERSFWGSRLGIDGWQPDFMMHHYPTWLVDIRGTEMGEYVVDSPHFTHVHGPVQDSQMPNFRFYSTTLTKNESVRLHHRVKNLCPVQELQAIAKNCNESREGKANPSHCWRENALFVKCNEFKKQFLTNRQRLFYIYGSIKDDVRESDDEDEIDPNSEDLDPDSLYVYRWEFYRMQYKEGKRKRYIRQMKAHKEAQQLSFWKRLTTPSTWFSAPIPAPTLPTHVKNYIYRGHHWLAPEDIAFGPPMPPEVHEKTMWSLPFEEYSEEEVEYIRQNDY